MRTETQHNRSFGMINFNIPRNSCFPVNLTLSIIILTISVFWQTASASVPPVTDIQAVHVSASNISEKPDLLSLPGNGSPVVVRASFHLQNINEIDEEAETFEFTGVLTLTWKDIRQAFDPEKIQAKEKIFQGSYQFNEIAPAWYPQVMLANESGLYEKHAVLLRVQPDGTSTLIETVNAAAETDLDLRKCPFDFQKLQAVFQVHGFDTSEVVLVADKTQQDDRTPDLRISQWVLTNLDFSFQEHAVPYAGSKGTASSFVVIADVQRKPFFMFRLIVFPLLLITALSWSVFWMDRASLGDRINLSFVGILTAVAYLMVVSDDLPQISYLTLIHGFINISFIFMCFTATINLIVGAMDKRGAVKKGDLIDYRCRILIPSAYFLALLTAAFAALFFL